MEFSRGTLQGFIDQAVEESASLEYKSAAALDRADSKKKTELTKDVSAFANAAGGVLIYGIKEFRDEAKRHQPEGFDPVDPAAYSKEWLDQMISQIKPRIDALKIHPISVGPKKDGCCYVVEIPQGVTAHQATDGRYHKRSNTITQIMDDYEIRDVMNRRKHPHLTAELKIRPDPVEGEAEVMLFVKNDGAVMARYFSAVVDMPYKIGREIVAVKEAVMHEIEGAAAMRFRLLTSLRPLFPDDETTLRAKIDLRSGRFEFVGRPSLPSIAEIRVTLFADDMPKVELRFDPSKVMLPPGPLRE